MMRSLLLLIPVALAATGIETPPLPPVLPSNTTSQGAASISVSCPSVTAAAIAASGASGVSNKATIFFIVVNAISMTINAVIVYSHIKHKRRKKHLEEQLREKQDVVEEQKNCLKLEIRCKRGELDADGRFSHATRYGCRDCGAEVYHNYGVYGDWNRRWSTPQQPPEVYEVNSVRYGRERLSDISTLRRPSVELEGASSFAGTERKKARSWKSKTVLRKKSLGLPAHELWDVEVPEIDV